MRAEARYLSVPSSVAGASTACRPLDQPLHRRLTGLGRGDVLGDGLPAGQQAACHLVGDESRTLAGARHHVDHGPFGVSALHSFQRGVERSQVRDQGGEAQLDEVDDGRTHGADQRQRRVFRLCRGRDGLAQRLFIGGDGDDVREPQGVQRVEDALGRVLGSAVDKERGGDDQQGVFPVRDLVQAGDVVADGQGLRLAGGHAGSAVDAQVLEDGGHVIAHADGLGGAGRQAAPAILAQRP